MKKTALLTLTLLIIFITASCRAAQEDKTVKYKDGTYTAQSEDSGYGYEKGIVTISNGKITNIELKRMKSDGSEVNYDEWVGQTNDEGEVIPNLKEYRITLANEIMEKQSTAEVDTIATATRSTRNWILIVNDCLEQAKQK